jgi:hypothetical protein
VTHFRKDPNKLDPAHVRVLNLLIQPAGMKRAGHVNIDFLCAYTHWEEGTVRSLLSEARKALGVNTTQQLMILWREKRKK